MASCGTQYCAFGCNKRGKSKLDAESSEVIATKVQMKNPK